jgi:hypothetical protein
MLLLTVQVLACLIRLFVVGGNDVGNVRCTTVTDFQVVSVEQFVKLV